MGRHKLGVSGSTILSNPDLFNELFWDDIDVIEIGEFPDKKAFSQFLDLSRENDIPFGIHSPLIRNGSKYDLIQKVSVDPSDAWEQLEKEAAFLSQLGAKYILVHFPYFLRETNENPGELIEAGLKKLHRIQHEYSINIICEPKLGMERSEAGIKYLDSFPIEIWEEYSLKLCVDIGDYLLATGDDIIKYLRKWKKHIKIVHLHNCL